MININTGACDQFHASGRKFLAETRKLAAKLRAEGLDDAQIVGRLVGSIGASVVGALDGADDDELFWRHVWQVCAGVAYAAVSEKGDNG